MPSDDELKTEISKSDKYKNLNQVGWESKISERAVDLKFDDELQQLEDMYVHKITNIRDVLRGDWNTVLTAYEGGKLKTAAQLGDELVEQLNYYLQKEVRLLDKFACVVKEIELRKGGLVSRTPHHTIYYADYVNGSDANSGLDINNAWKTIHQYTTETVRSPGDILKLRAYTTWDYGATGENRTIEFDEDGNDDNYITLKGCDSVDDPWGDGSDVKAVIDFKDAGVFVHPHDDNFWKFENIDFRQSGYGSGIIYAQYVDFLYLKNCKIRDCDSYTSTGLYAVVCGMVIVEDCTFENCNNYSIYCYGSRLYAKNCTFLDGSDVGTDYFIHTSSGANVDVVESTFGSDSMPDSGDIRAAYNSLVRVRNCSLSGKGITKFINGKVFFEDYDKNFEDSRAYYSNGASIRDTSITRTGGADSSARMEPGSVCGPNYPLTLCDDNLAGDFKLWCPASQTTVAIYARTCGNWTADPTSSEFYIQASYLNSAPARSTVKSTASLNGVNWVSFNVTFTPTSAGWVYVTVNLKKYESGKCVYVDIKPVVS